MWSKLETVGGKREIGGSDNIESEGLEKFRSTLCCALGYRTLKQKRTEPNNEERLELLGEGPRNDGASVALIFTAGWQGVGEGSGVATCNAWGMLWSMAKGPMGFLGVMGYRLLKVVLRQGGCQGPWMRGVSADLSPTVVHKCSPLASPWSEIRTGSGGTLGACFLCESSPLSLWREISHNKATVMWGVLTARGDEGEGTRA